MAYMLDNNIIRLKEISKIVLRYQAATLRSSIDTMQKILAHESDTISRIVEAMDEKDKYNIMSIFKRLQEANYANEILLNALDKSKDMTDDYISNNINLFKNVHDESKLNLFYDINIGIDIISGSKEAEGNIDDIYGRINAIINHELTTYLNEVRATNYDTVSSKRKSDIDKYISTIISDRLWFLDADSKERLKASLLHQKLNLDELGINLAEQLILHLCKFKRNIFINLVSDIISSNRIKLELTDIDKIDRLTMPHIKPQLEAIRICQDSIKPRLYDKQLQGLMDYGQDTLATLLLVLPKTLQSKGIVEVKGIYDHFYINNLVDILNKIESSLANRDQDQNSHPVTFKVTTSSHSFVFGYIENKWVLFDNYYIYEFDTINGIANEILSHATHIDKDMSQATFTITPYCLKVDRECVEQVMEQISTEQGAITKVLLNNLLISTPSDRIKNIYHKIPFVKRNPKDTALAIGLGVGVVIGAALLIFLTGGLALIPALAVGIGLGIIAFLGVLAVSSQADARMRNYSEKREKVATILQQSDSDLAVAKNSLIRKLTNVRKPSNDSALQRSESVDQTLKSAPDLKPDESTPLIRTKKH
jgi:hypothetical protein